MVETLNTRLAKHGVDFPFLLAPMVGISHVAFRELVNEYVPHGLQTLRFTEMLSSRRLPTERLDRANELRIAEAESGFIPQVLANEEKFIEASFRKLDQQNPWGYDINMGCPVKHTLRHNWGVRLMGDPEYAAGVVKAARRHTDRPLSVKMRGGDGDQLDFEFLERFTEALESAGADWITIHARPKAQKHRGKSDWGLVGRIAKNRSIPVVANGDIQTSQDAINCIREYGADGAMVARAAVARPWIFWQIAEDLGLENKPIGRELENAPRGKEAEGQEFLRSIIRLGELLDHYFESNDYKLKRLRFYIITASKYFLWGHSFWKLTTKGDDFTEVLDRVREYAVDRDFPMTERIVN